MKTWREMIDTEMKNKSDDWANVESSTLDDIALDLRFDAGYGTSEGEPFTIWTKDRVYFPCVYDGAEWCESVARHPDGVATVHLGGQ